MDKILQKHYDTYIKVTGSSDQIRAHATITEDMMGRFAEWKNREYWVISTIKGKWFNLTTGQIATMPELIQLFKATL